MTELHLDENFLDNDPIRQFQLWFDDAVAANLPDPNAMTLASATLDGKPAARMVLLKNVDQRGFVFFTNYISRKSRELITNPFASLIFFWPQLTRQVRVEGAISKVSAEESDAYFQSRPRDSQIGAHTSPQSEPIASREYLESRFAELKHQFEGKTIPRPAHWGGFRVKPQKIEFWLGHPARLNERVLYELQSDGTWKKQRLAP
jgi:pyridoxamine 5'-phosphate oxidase